MDTSQVTYEALVKENKTLRVIIDQLSHNSDNDSIINVWLISEGVSMIIKYYLII